MVHQIHRLVSTVEHLGDVAEEVEADLSSGEEQIPCPPSPSTDTKVEASPASMA